MPGDLRCLYQNPKWWGIATAALEAAARTLARYPPAAQCRRACTPWPASVVRQRIALALARVTGTSGGLSTRPFVSFAGDLEHTVHAARFTTLRDECRRRRWAVSTTMSMTGCVKSGQRQLSISFTRTVSPAWSQWFLARKCVDIYSIKPQEHRRPAPPASSALTAAVLLALEAPASAPHCTGGSFSTSWRRSRFGDYWSPVTTLLFHGRWPRVGFASLAQPASKRQNASNGETRTNKIALLLHTSNVESDFA